MSAIGDYVHYTSYGYIKYGINKIGQKGSSINDAASIFNTQRDKINELSSNSIISKTEMQKLEQAIESLMRPSSNSDQEEALNELWSQLVVAYQKEFPEAVERINRETGNIEKSSLNISKIKTKGHSNVLESTILNRINSINSDIAQIKSITEKNKLQNIVNKISQDFEKLTGIQQAAFQQTEGLITKKARKNNKLSLNGEAGNIVEQINKIAARTSGLINLQKGALFEYLIAVAPLVGKGYGEKELSDYLQKTVKGSNKSNVYISDIKFSPDIKLNQVLGSKYSYNPNSHLYAFTKPTQDKVDVTIEWNNYPLNISAKNVNLNMYSHPDVSILTNGSLLTILQSINEIAVNHYLNIVSKHRDPSKSIDQSLLNTAHEFIKIGILEGALKGYKLQQQQANVFIINDNQTGKVKVYDINQLIEKAIKDIQNNITITSSNGDIENLTFINAWQENIAGRLTNLFSEIHKQKISVKINKSVFS